jgi:hypothetical protein
MVFESTKSNLRASVPNLMPLVISGATLSGCTGQLESQSLKGSLSVVTAAQSDDQQGTTSRNVASSDSGSLQAEPNDQTKAEGNALPIEPSALPPQVSQASIAPSTVPMEATPNPAQATPTPGPTSTPTLTPTPGPTVKPVSGAVWTNGCIGPDSRVLSLSAIIPCRLLLKG